MFCMFCRILTDLPDRLKGNAVLIVILALFIGDVKQMIHALDVGEKKC